MRKLVSKMKKGVTISLIIVGAILFFWIILNSYAKNIVREDLRDTIFDLKEQKVLVNNYVKRVESGSLDNDLALKGIEIIEDHVLFLEDYSEDLRISQNDPVYIEYREILLDVKNDIQIARNKIGDL